MRVRCLFLLFILTFLKIWWPKNFPSNKVLDLTHFCVKHFSAKHNAYYK